MSHWDKRHPNGRCFLILDYYLYDSHRLLHVVEDIAAELPPDRNISNGKAEYGRVTAPNISVATLRFHEDAENFSVALVFYKPKISGSIQNGSKLSGKYLRDQKIEAVDGDSFNGNIYQKSDSAQKLFQGAVQVSSAIVEFTQKSCESCLINSSTIASVQQSSVVLTLFEKTDLFADNSAVSEKRQVISPLIAVRVSIVDGPVRDLPENVTIHFPVVQVTLRSSQRGVSTHTRKFTKVHRSASVNCCNRQD